MSKEFKEKYERVCQIKDRSLSLVESQLNGNIENVDAKELGEVADIAKDMAEIMELCAEAEYYHAITEAMEKNSDAENRMQMDKYLPEARYYGGPPIVYTNGNGSGGNSGGMSSGGSNGGSGGGSRGGSRYYNPMDMYLPTNDMGQPNGRNPMESMRDPREGRAGITRRTYMDMKNEGADPNSKMKELEEYIHDLADDINEMLEGMSPAEKSSAKQKIATLASKITV